MNFAVTLPLVLLLATTGSIAQGATGAACPVGMQATHGASLPVSRNAGGVAGQGPAINGRPLVPRAPVSAVNQQIHLVMNNLVARDIVSAQFTAHGFSNKQRTTYAGAAQGPDLSSSVEVFVDVKGNGHASSDLSLSHFTAVASIDLDSLTYADGSTWRSATPGACSVVPDMVMLIAATN